MRIPTSSFHSGLLNELQKLSQKQQQYSEQLASATRIKVGSDDPSGYANVHEVASRTRSMESYRSNMDRARLVGDLTDTSLNLLNSVVKEAISAANLLNTSIDDQDTMEANARLINNLIEQALTAINTEHNGEFLFSGADTQQQPLEIYRNADGKVSFGGVIQQEVGAPPPQLIVGNTYRIENAEGVNFQTGGAARNEAGVVFTYSGGEIDWVPGGPASLSMIEDNITESSRDLLIVGEAYEIVKKGDNTEVLDSGSPSNEVGTQFIYNGKLPATWDGLELAHLVTDYDNQVIEQHYEQFEFYKITSGSSTEYSDNAVDTILTDTFQFNGVPVANDQAEAALLAKPINEDNQSRLVQGQLYQVVSTTSGITGGGAIAAGEGEIFEYDGTAITDWGESTLIQVGEDTDNNLDQFFDPLGDQLVVGQYYKISSTDGTDNFSFLSTPPNAGTVGTVFQYDGVPVVYGNSILTPMTASLGSAELDATDIGSAFIVVGGNGSFSGGGAGLNAIAGTRFVYDGTAIVPSDFGGATLTPLTEDVAQVNGLAENKLYRVAKSQPKGVELPNLQKGDDLVAGKIYRIEKVGDTTDLSGTGAGTGPYEVGDVFTATGIQPTEWDGAELKSLVLQTAEPITSGPLAEGRSYQIAAVSSSATDNIFTQYEVNLLVPGQEYEILNNGSQANFSQAGGVNMPDLGHIFTYNGSTDIDWGNAVLVEVGGNGAPLTGTDQLVTGTQYQVVDNGSPLDMTRSGANSNATGTKFVYNGVGPSFGVGQLIQVVPATDFTPGGAPNNTVGTSFTYNDEASVEFGGASAVYLYRPEFTEESDFKSIGSTSNDVGTVFNYNGESPDFANINGEDGVLFGYKRAALASSYAGDDKDRPEYFVAEDIKASTHLDPAFSSKFADIVNNLVFLRDAFQTAADADPSDDVALFSSREIIKDAATRLDESDGDMMLAISVVAMDTLALGWAEEKDNRLNQDLQEFADSKTAIDDKVVAMRMNLALNAYQMALEASARRQSISILNFIS